MPKKPSPMELSLDYLGKCGYQCQIVERRLPIPGKHITQDCFGIADILAYKPCAGQATGGIVLVQTTSWGHFSHRKAKILKSPHHAPWKRSGGHICLHAWGDKCLRAEWL